MGGVIYSRLMRSLRTFNVANRAEKIISQEKPTPAPQYASTKKQKEILEQVHPGFLEEHYQKNIHLDQRLKDVFVTSTDVQDVKPETSKFLPQNRCSIGEFSMNYYESAVIPEGKCTVKQAFAFISQHKDDPIKYSSENIAAQYKIDKKVMDHILKHFKVYVNFMPNSNDLGEYEPDPVQNTVDKLRDEAKKEKEKLKKLKK